MSKVTAILLAAGQGTRMGSTAPKQYLEIGGLPIFMHALKTLEQSNLVENVILVAGSQEIPRISQLVSYYQAEKVQAIVPGGKERSHSVYQGLGLLSEDCSLVVVHDGVRPFFNLDLLENVIITAEATGAAIPGVPVKDTIKICNKSGQVISTPSRESLWAIQTPQVFRKDWLLEAYEDALTKNIIATDDAGLLERQGRPVQVVMGDYENIKLTTPEDVSLAKGIWERRQG